MSYGVLVEKTVPVSRQKVFATFMDFGGIDKLAPAGMFKSVTCEGEGIGAIRTLTLNEDAGGGQIVERLDVAYDERVFGYSILGKSSLPFDNYVAIVELEDAGDGCVVRYACNCDPADGSTESDVRTMLEGLYTTICDNLA
jgi:hypothetical protein